MNIPDGATQQIRTRITHKSHSYTLIGRLFYFCGKDDIFRCVVKKAVVSNLLREFYKSFCGEHFPRRGPVENFFAAEFYWTTMFYDIFLLLQTLQGLPSVHEWIYGEQQLASNSLIWAIQEMRYYFNKSFAGY